MFITLTYTQIKQMLANVSGDIEAVQKFLIAVEEQPAFIYNMQPLDTVNNLQAILQGGCASGAYMPAVTYHTANLCMAEYHTEIEELLTEDGCDSEWVFNTATDSWACFASKLVASAVEVWVGQFADILDGVDWD
ncbi:MAG: hypothetical protein V3S69_05375 [Dehalococcoidales bacterium]